MADDPILTAIQSAGKGGGVATAEEDTTDPILLAINAAGKPRSNLHTPSLDELATGVSPEIPTTALPSLPPSLSIPPPTFDTTQIPRSPFTNQFEIAPNPDQVRAQIAAEDAAAVAADQRARMLAITKKPITPEEESEQAASAAKNLEWASTGPQNFPIATEFAGVVPVEFTTPKQIQAQARSYLGNPAVPKTRAQAFFAGAGADAVKTLNDMFLSPIGLAATALGLSETTALARAGAFGTDAARLGQEYVAMRDAGASGAELADVEGKMRQSILSAAKAQKAAVAARKVGVGAGAAFSAGGAVGVGKGIQEKNVPEILGGLGQIALGGAALAGVHEAGGLENQVKAQTAARVAKNLEAEGPVTAQRITQIPQEVPTAPKLPEGAEPVGVGEQLAPEPPETLKAQTTALANGTNKAVYFPNGTENLPEVPDSAKVTKVAGNKPGAGTWYHDPSITPQQIRSAVKDGTYGQLLGYAQPKEEAAQGVPTALVARDEKGTELKAAVVDSANPQAVATQAATLAKQFPEAQIATEAPEQVIAARQAPPPAKPEKSEAPAALSEQTQGVKAPKYAYRVRTVGDQGVPSESHSQATVSLDEARGYMESRGNLIGKPQELVRVDLSKLPEEAYSLLPGPNGNDWVKFNKALSETAVEAVPQPKAKVSKVKTKAAVPEQAIPAVPAQEKPTHMAGDRVQLKTAGKENGQTGTLEGFNPVTSVATVKLDNGQTTRVHSDRIGPVEKPVDHILEAINAEAGPQESEELKSVKVNINGKMQAPQQVRATGTPGLYATHIKGAGWSLTHGATGLKVPVGATPDLESVLDAAAKLKGVTDWTKDFKNLKKWESAALGEKVTAALGKSASMRAAEESAEETVGEEEAKPVEEPEKNLTRESTIPVGEENAGEREATQRMGTPGERALAEVPPENVPGTGGERAAPSGAPQRRQENEQPTGIQRAKRNEPVGGEKPSHAGQPVPAERGRHAEPGRELSEQARSGQSGNDYRITEADKIGQGTIREKFAANAEAIRVLKELESAGRPATTDEQSKLVKYSGWGWSGNRLSEYHDEWRNERRILQELLTDEEYESAVASTKNAHYTSPEVVNAVWAALDHLGFTGGRLLEPSAGVGHFLGLMPNEPFVNSRKTAIELDSISGRILKQLYQTADVRIQGFEKLTGLNDFYDLALSNVPFGDYKVHDPAYNKYKLSIHNYFITKMLDKVRPGGLVAVITSHHTMDAGNPQVRKLLADRGDLLGAIRLPGGAFEKNAGTDVTTDILFFRKRASGEKPAGEAFTETKPVAVGNGMGTADVNEYFVKHPEMALGTHSLAGTMYGYGKNYKLLPSKEPLEELLSKAIAQLPEKAMKEFAPPASVTRAATAESIPAWGETKPFGLAVKDGKVYQHLNGQMIEQPEFPKGNVHILKGMLDIRNAVRELFQSEAKGRPAKETAENRALLNRLYDAFVKKNGYLNHPRNMRIADMDPDAPLLWALENWDPRKRTASKADAFFKQTVAPRKEITKVDRPEDALPASLAEHGKIDFPYMAKISGLSEEELQNNLSESGAIFKTPQGHWETRDEYLSGNVRQKLHDAEEAAKIEPQFEKNAAALKVVQPRDLEAGEISVRVGTPWIPEEDISKFIDDVILENPGYSRYKTRVTHIASEGIWKIDKSVARYNEAAQTKWGTGRVRPLDIIEDALNLRRPTVYDRAENDKTVINEKETLAAREKLEQIEQAFVDWVFKDPERAERLVAQYNENFNNLVDREWDGSHLTFPGKAAGISLRPNQVRGVWRSLVGGNVLLAHVVGSGKTYTIVASAMEARRLGLAKKPMVVVPNHLVEQWAQDWLTLYPQARVLAATRDQWGTKNRKTLMSKIATGEWDAVIVPHSSFTLLPVSDETFKRYAQRQLDMIEEHLSSAKEERDRRTVKELEKAKARIMARLEKALNRERKDNTINFEDTGVDRLYVDEAHLYKNLFFATKMGNINGVPKSDAQRSMDMYIKAKYISDLNNGSGVIFATGTPISNTMAEIYTMQRYMNEGMLEQLGLAHFDSWAAAYGQTIQNMEVSPEDPTKFRISSRFAKFINVAELKRMFRQNADVILPEDLEGIIKVPELVGGKPEVVEVPASQRVLDYIQELGARATLIRKKAVRPDEDNMLKITSEGRKVALDYRSMFPEADDDGMSKITVAARKIADIYHETRDTKRTQVVFLDLMTPTEAGKKKGQFNAYADLKRKLVHYGVPAEQVAFIHDAKTDAAKQAIFDRVNEGDISVIVGSTDKMGVGTNIQERLLVGHNIDAPWRPSDIEQRGGRFIRQGNTNPFVREIRYVTQGTFDAYMWSTIARKAQFIHEMMQHGYDVRELEDADGASLSYAEAAAIATGDKRVLEKVKIDADVDRLLKLKTVHDQQRLNNQVKLAGLPERISGARQELSDVQDDIKTRDKYSAEDFRVQVGNAVYTDRKEAGAALNAAFDEARRKAARTTVGTYRGLKISVLANVFIGDRRSYVFVQNHENPLGTIQSMERTVDGLENRVRAQEENIAMLDKDMGARKAEIEKPFTKQKELDKALAKQKELNEALAVNKEDKTMAGARPDEEFDENFKEIEPSRAVQPKEEGAESLEEGPIRLVNPQNPEAGFMVNPFIELGNLIYRIVQKFRGGARTPMQPKVAVAPRAKEAPREEPSVPVMRPEPERAGNIRLDKLNAPEDVIEEIRRMAKEHPSEYNEQRRGEIPFSKTRDMAQRLVDEGMFTERDLKNMEKGTALNAEELLAARSLLIASAKRVREAALEVRENPSAQATLRFQRELQRHSGIQKAVSGAVAEAGRALSQQRIIANAMEKNDRTGHERVIEALGGQELSDEAARRLSEIPADDVVALNNFIRSQRYWTTAQKIEAYWIANVLSSPRTTIKKTTGDITLTVLESANRFGQALIDPILAAIQGREREHSARGALSASVAYVSAVPEATRKAMYIIQHGFDPEDPLALELPHKYEFPGGIKNPWNVPTRALSAITKFFQIMAFQGELHARAFNQALKEGHRGAALTDRAAALIQHPSDEMIDAAAQQAQLQTYTEAPDTLMRMLLMLRDKVKLPRGVPLVGGLRSFQFIIPFVQIPYNLAKTSLRYSPLGALRLNDREVWRNGKAASIMSRALIGTAIMGLFAYLAAKKLLTGAAPSDPAGRDAFYREGKQPFSIKVGNRWVSYTMAGPLALNAAASAAWYDRYQKTGNPPISDEIWNLVSSMGQAMANESFMSGIKNIMDAVDDPQRAGSRWATGLAGGFVPLESAQRTVATGLDPTVRSPQGMYQQILSGLPVVSKGVPPKLDVLGRPSVREGQRGFAAAIPGGIAKAEPESSIDAELGRLHDLGLRNPGFAGAHLAVDRYRMTLTPDERDRYQAIRGAYLRSYLGQVFASKEYQSMGDQDKITEAEAAIHQAEADARNTTISEVIAKRRQEAALRVPTAPHAMSAAP